MDPLAVIGLLLFACVDFDCLLHQVVRFLVADHLRRPRDRRRYPAVGNACSDHV